MREFKVGDRCRIRQWDDMVREFGVSSTGKIEIPGTVFGRKMEPLCGLPFTIKKCGIGIRARDKTVVHYYLSEEGVEKRGLNGNYFDDNNTWAITADMLEYDESEFEPVTEDELASLPGF